MMRKEWKFDEDKFESLKHMMDIISPSMEENKMASYLHALWGNRNVQVKLDVMGNLHAVLNKDANIQVGLVAHMDTVAVQVSQILPNGAVRFRSIGIRPHVLLGQKVKILSKNDVVEGVVGFDPISQYGQPKGLVEEDLWIDIGADDYEDAVSKIEIGDLGVFEPTFSCLNGKYLCGTGLDNRVGVFILTECLHWFLDNVPTSVCLHVIGTTQEEIGLRGASIIASSQPLDACFVIDVDYATDTLFSHENVMGCLCLGKGLGIHIKSDNNSVLRDMVCDIADRRGILYQKSLGRFLYGGTDATAIQLQNGGIATMNISVPCRYMHSPVEVCHKSDVEAVINLLIEAVDGINDKKLNDFIPQY